MSTEMFSLYANYYELFYRGKNYTDETNFVDRLLRDAGSAPGTLLDVGCGIGAHARHFAKKGWMVTGIDLSPTMIEIARRGSPVELGVQFFVGDAANFILGQMFSAAVSLFHVVSYQATREEALKMFINVRKHLFSGGCFVFDFWHGPGVLADPPVVRVHRYENEDVRLIRIAEPSHDPVCRTVDVSYELLVEHIKNRTLDRIKEIHRLRYFDLTEIKELLQMAGFKMTRAYAGMSGSALHPGSWYGLVVAIAQ